MVCCGLFALLVAALLGVWRRLRAWPRTTLALLVAVLAARSPWARQSRAGSRTLRCGC
jgi:hypothetical protein